MKCPKCGGKFVLNSTRDYGWCSMSNKNGGCGTNFRGKELQLKLDEYYKELEQKKYQTRLDKVLSKFAGTTNFLCYANFIVYSNEQFTIEFDYKDIKISLDTVESLIKDLEGN